ncbi:MAG TPA: GrpB family protein [Usitatibacter sp.]|nr:GrpB family protein [Usitatibacter sp.]
MSDKEVVLTPYSPLWPAVFDIEQRRLLEIFNDSVVVEHIGSTAVPGLGAKPVIDVMLGSPDLAVVEGRIPTLEADGWRYVPEFERAMPERRYFTKLDQPPGKFHLHAVVLGGLFWQRHLAFRDALRADPRLAQRYWRVKQHLAARFPDDRAAYTEAKGDFIRAVLEQRP